MKLGLLLKNAFRDSRRDRSKLVLFMSSIVLGVAALVAINSFNYNLVNDIDNQAKSLLGADLVFESNKPFQEDWIKVMDSIPAEKASEVALLSMAYLPQQSQSQFVRIKALGGGFPFYGKLLTEPENVDFQKEKTALVDDGMMLQYSAEIGDSIKLGQETFVIGGRLKNAFGSVDLGSGFAPTVYIGRESLAATELIQPGSLVDYSIFLKTADDFNPDEWRDSKRDDFRDNGMRIQTVEGQKENLQQAFSSLNNFLNLIALVSLLLACIGVASSVLIYVKNKVKSIAIFRCLGMNGNEAFLIYFIQIFVLSLVSVLIGAAIGSGIQMLLPIVFDSFLPYEVDMNMSWRAIGEGILVGSVITLLFALVPLIRIRNISPLRTLRSSYEEEQGKFDRLEWGIYALIILSIFGFLWSLTGNIKDAGMFTGGLLVAFGILFGVAKLITFIVRKFFPRNWNFIFRQGLSNLYRPNNQTRTLIVSIGLGTAILTTLFIIQGLILGNVGAMGAGNQANTILFGIETKQKDELAEITRNYDMPLMQETPIITMDLYGWKGKTKQEWLADTTRTARRWAINREARVSYADSISKNDKIIAGEYTSRVEPGDSVFVSLGESWARSLDVDLGDEIVWNVQGALIKTYVGSLREINFRSMDTRFFILFPLGVLEEAPQFHVLVTKTPDAETTAAYRNEVVQKFPNVSIIDLGSILVTLNDILSKLSYAIQFMAGFSILIGLIVLISSLFLSKYQRINESVLMRTLGAVKKQILRINMVEYGLLGALSSLTGIFIALLSSFLLVKFVFELEFAISWLPILVIFILVTLITILIGLANSREVVNKPPLEILRNNG
ncbi:ABC transporter permease [Portibacter lacus]|uniref:Permease n=1 Tax=Portibacter lacus TaxID=1099794 RepID=A0AA37SR44_9BACT|nr:FtsX-like permease family protein [Portibacter lacus]GLR16145.1 permease [Portibacter lacus]